MNLRHSDRSCIPVMRPERRNLKMDGNQHSKSFARRLLFCPDARKNSRYWLLDCDGFFIGARVFSQQRIASVRKNLTADCVGSERHQWPSSGCHQRRRNSADIRKRTTLWRKDIDVLHGRDVGIHGISRIKIERQQVGSFRKLVLSDCFRNQSRVIDIYSTQ